MSAAASFELVFILSLLHSSIVTLVKGWSPLVVVGVRVIQIHPATKTEQEVGSRFSDMIRPRIASSLSCALFRRNTSAARSVRDKRSWATATVLAFSTLTCFTGYTLGFQRSHAKESNFTSTKTRIGKPYYGGAKELHYAVPEMEAGGIEISTDEDDLQAHGFSEWSTFNIEQNPIAIAYPRNTEDVSLIAKTCHKLKLPMIAYSGGSSLEGNFSATRGGVCIDFREMNRILDVRVEDMDATVQPSVGWVELNEHLESQGVFFPVDPGPPAKIGGMTGTGASGTNAVRYGTMRDWIINLTVVMADGTVIKTRQRPRKSSAGYNLNNLFCGSEGTLGLVTEITVKLTTIPVQTSVAVCTFPTVRAVAATAAEVVRKGIPIGAVECMCEAQMAVINRAGYTKRKWEEVPTLFLKFSGTASGVKEQIQQVREISKSHGGGKFEFARDAEEQKQLWSARKEVLYSNLAMRKSPGSEVFSTDIAVPLSKMADLVEYAKNEFVKAGLEATVLGHVGDGNFHTSIVYDKTNPEEVAVVDMIVANMTHRALELEGTCTGEHGIGMTKKRYIIRELGVDTVSLMRKIKLALDPLELLNPDKIIPLDELYAKGGGL